MHTHPLAHYVPFLDRGELEGIGKLMLSSAQKLASIGAELLICPDNTIHQAFAYATERSAVPWLHIAEVTAQAAKNRGFRRLGLMGTRWLVKSEVYPEKLSAQGLQYVRPDPSDVEIVNSIIMDELVRGIHRPESLVLLQEVIQRLADRGCDAAVLGCTELPIVLNDCNAPLPTLDSTRVLARAALEAAMA